MSRLLDILKSKNRKMTTSCMQHICQLVTISSSFTTLWMTPSGHTISSSNLTKESFSQTFLEIKNTSEMVRNPTLTHGDIGKSTPKKMQALWMLKLSLRSQLRKGVEKSSLCKLVSLKITNGSIITSQILSVSALGSKTLILISN